MSQVTRFNGDYTFHGVDATSNVVVNSHTLVVNGNLNVAGSTTVVNSTNTEIADRIITLNQGEPNDGVTGVYSGIEIDRGGLAKTSIRWNEATTRWELTTDGSTFSPIISGYTGITAVIEDTAPQLGGNLDVLSQSIFSSTTQVIKHDTNVAIKNSEIAPSTLSGYNTVYAQTPSSGGSGLFITNTTNQQQELVTKTKAIVFALIM